MPSTYSDALRLEKQANGENDATWGTKLNTVIDLIEAAIAGRAAVTHDDSASYTLTTSNSVADEARNMIIDIGGALTAARNTVVPTKNKLYVVKNSTTGGYATTVKTSAGSGISVPNGKTTLLAVDGTNVVDAINYLSSLVIGAALSVGSTLAVASDVAVNTNKFNITASSGNTTIAGTLGLSDALTYGGVTLSNSVTGTGSMVLSTSPTLTAPNIGAATGSSLNIGSGTLTAGLGTFADRVIGGTWSEDGSDPHFVSFRTISGGSDGSAHGFQDYSTFTKGAGNSQYNSFFARPTLGGTQNFNHVVGFQSYPISSTSGTVDEVESFKSWPNITAGTVTDLHHAGIYAAQGAGTITTEYGVRLMGTSGAGTNIPISSTWTGASFLAGSFGIANNKYFQTKNATGTLYNLLGVDASNHTYLGNSGLSGNIYIITNGATVATMSATGVTIVADLAVNGGDLTTSQTTFNLINATATTVNFAGGASTALNLGHASGTTTVAGKLTVNTAGGNVTWGGGGTLTTLAQTNLDGNPTCYASHMRVGDWVHVCGYAVCDPTAAGVFEFRLTPPISTTFTGATEAFGTVTGTTGASEASLYSDAVNNRVIVTATAASGSACFVYFSFQYKVL